MRYKQYRFEELLSKIVTLADRAPHEFQIARRQQTTPKNKQLRGKVSGRFMASFQKPPPPPPPVLLLSLSSLLGVALAFPPRAPIRVVRACGVGGWRGRPKEKKKTAVSDFGWRYGVWGLLAVRSRSNCNTRGRHFHFLSRGQSGIGPTECMLCTPSSHFARYEPKNAARQSAGKARG